MHRLLWIVLFFLNLFLLYQILWGNTGFMNYEDLKSRHQALETKLRDLEKRSMALSEEIRWLKSDRSYIERTIRNEMNFLKDNEILYLLSENATVSGGGAQTDERKN